MNLRVGIPGGLFAIFVYTGWSLFSPLEDGSLKAIGWVVLVSMYAVMLWVPLVIWRREEDESSSWDNAIQWVSFSSMGMLSFLLVTSLGRDLLAAFGVGFARGEQGTLGALLASGALFVLGFVSARFRVRIKNVSVRIAGLPPAFAGLKILQLSDVHIGPTIGVGFIRGIVDQSMAAKPDLIVITGDLADGMPADLKESLAPLAELEAPLGKFYVPGNHEYYWDGAGWLEAMKGLGFRVLANDGQVIERDGAQLGIAGITDPAAHGRGEGPDVRRARASLPDSVTTRILLCHQPQYADEAEKLGFQLQLSGHTHGGQFFPWTLVTHQVHRHNAGLYRQGDLQVYVSSGTGYWGPPVRLARPPKSRSSS